ncbi:MAG: hypothetical protein PVJ16_00175 [Nitrosopumilaceae archaeon]
MTQSTYEKTSVVALKCGCIVGVSGEINKECIPHSQGNFIQ